MFAALPLSTDLARLPTARRGSAVRRCVTGLALALVANVAAAVELTMWVMPVTTNAQRDIPELLVPFLKQHPDITVRVTVLDWESGWNKITAAAASRRGP